MINVMDIEKMPPYRHHNNGSKQTQFINHFKVDFFQSKNNATI